MLIFGGTFQNGDFLMLQTQNKTPESFMTGQPPLTYPPQKQGHIKGNQWS